jgi:hypothetical protein
MQVPLGERNFLPKGAVRLFHWGRRQPDDTGWPSLFLEVTAGPRGIDEDPGPGPDLKAVQSSDGKKVWVAEDEKRVRFWRPGLSLDADLERYRAKAYVTHPEEWMYAHRIIFSLGYLNLGGILLHAASVVKNGMAYVFTGHSGAGKSTIVRNSPRLPVLSDEVLGVQVRPDNSHPIAFGSPFFGDWGRPGEEMSAPIKGIYFPVKSSHNRLEPLNAAETLALLLPCVWSFTTWEPRLRAMFDITTQLAERIPGYRLHCRPEPSLWEVLDET